MDRVFEARLIECLSALEENEPIEKILARYPEDAPRLRPILQVAAALPGLALEPHLDAQESSRQRFLAGAAAIAPPVRGDTRSPIRRPLIFEAFGAVILVLCVSALLFAISGSSLPGSPLYGLKRTVEDVRLALTTQENTRKALEQQLNQERIDEIKTLLAQGIRADVVFTGSIELLQPDTWQIAGLAVTIDSHTQIIGTPQVGLTAQVQGQVMSGRLLAGEISIEMAPEPTPTVELEGTATLYPTLTPMPTTTPTPTPVPPHMPTATPMMPSGATPTAEDNGHDGPGDGDNQNSNDNNEGSGSNDNGGHDGEEGTG